MVWEWKRGVLGSGDSTAQSWGGEAQNLLASDIFMNIYIFLFLSLSSYVQHASLCAGTTPCPSVSFGGPSVHQPAQACHSQQHPRPAHRLALM